MGARLSPVSLVEDDPSDVLITREAVAERLWNRLDVATDGTDALARLRRRPPYRDGPLPGDAVRQIGRLQMCVLSPDRERP